MQCAAFTLSKALPTLLFVSKGEGTVPKETINNFLKYTHVYLHLNNISKRSMYHRIW